MQQLGRRALRTLALGTLAGGWVAIAAAPAFADLTVNTADCRGSVQITGDNGDIVTANESSTAFTIPASGDYSATGSISGQDGQERTFAGWVKLDLPPLFQPLAPKIWSWGGIGTGYSTTEPKVGHYDLPGAVPAGVPFPITAVHIEKGVEVCRFEGTVTVQGSGGLTSPVGLGLVGATVLTGAGTAMAGIPRKGK